MDIRRDAEVLYEEIDACVGSLVSGLMRGDEEKVDAALQQTGYLLARTMQFLRCFMDSSGDALNNDMENTKTQ